MTVNVSVPAVSASFFLIQQSDISACGRGESGGSGEIGRPGPRTYRRSRRMTTRAPAWALNPAGRGDDRNDEVLHPGDVYRAPRGDQRRGRPLPGNKPSLEA